MFVERLILMVTFSLLVLVDHQVDLRREEFEALHRDYRDGSRDVPSVEQLDIHSELVGK